MTHFIKKMDAGLARIETYILVFLVLFLLFFAFLQVVLRNFFDSGINWADVLNRSLVIWVGFFGATLSAVEDKHLSLEVLTKFLPAKFHPPIRIFVSIFTMIVCCILAYYSQLFFIDQITYEASDFLFEGFPKAYITVIFPFGFALLALHYLLKTLLSLLALTESKPEPVATAAQFAKTH